MPEALVAIGRKKSVVLSVDGAGARSQVGSGVALEAVGACRLPSGALCVPERRVR